ncbi:MAG: hypothetical protein A3G32_01220 [Deltaproteobacteria bacterium RIFCSPLOWO2_12_FULL_40_28]|nr:MAG: hypothetical protein A3C45_10105 [Deltaproteobacteria bacterium RIFCSPHIGHO2_02_FULL_40_28]OGQ19950.1 MAG: hypothetical protein A3E27_07055 [Deltaproteobacteria bacterium RIFCSPHIGHO2_12_FULL_40_32]OGQ39710.1 MAG: hypothetical protein A3I69_06485 [Deltaproteobacteria bacterium RIFCSPLOWO2_02_FULL_40_36]OGQ52965.1 MAG: hypothetical protein A3G32_01220 [Deltaproteobacteria bacterium RIFCSPLOWO2_12_FULL_40_28]
MSHQKFVTGLVLLLLCVSFGVKAQGQVGSTPIPGKDMHSVMPGMEMGRLEGDLFAIDSTGEKKFLPNHEVMIKVYRQNDELLSLNKHTDEKGHFIFKNIFKDPAFEYALGFYHEGQLFVINGLKLEKGKDAINVDFRVGEGSPYLVPEEIINAQMEQQAASQGMSGMPAGQASPAKKTASGSLKQSPQKVVALFLFLVVLVVFLYLMKRQLSKRAKS